MKEISVTAKLVTLKQCVFHVDDDREVTKDSVRELVCDSLNGEFSVTDWHDTFESTKVRLYRESGPEDWPTVLCNVAFEVEPIGEDHQEFEDYVELGIA